MGRSFMMLIILRYSVYLVLCEASKKVFIWKLNHMDGEGSENYSQ